MFISVIIPTFNRRLILEKCIKSLENQTVDSDIEGYEILVVDDGSSDGTISWLKNQCNLFPHVRLIEQEHGGPALARNKGVENSTGNLIVFIDSDLVVTDSFLNAHVQSLKKCWDRRKQR